MNGGFRLCAHPCASTSLCHVCSEGTVTVRRKWLQLTRDPAVHLGPEVSGHGSAGNHPREEHGHPAPAADQQVRRLLGLPSKAACERWGLRAFAGSLEIALQSWRRNFKALKCQDCGVCRVSVTVTPPVLLGAGLHVRFSFELLTLSSSVLLLLAPWRPHLQCFNGNKWKYVYFTITSLIPSSVCPDYI